MTTAPSATRIRIPVACPTEAAQRLAGESDVPQILIGVKRPVETREETDVDELQDQHQPEQRSDDPDQHGPSSGGEDSAQRDQNEALEWESQKRVELERNRLVGPDQGGPHEQQGRGS